MDKIKSSGASAEWWRASNGDTSKWHKNQIVETAGDIITCLQERGTVDARHQVSQWLNVAADHSEPSEVRVFALSAVDRVISNIVVAIQFNREDSKSGIFGESMSTSIRHRAEKLMDEAPLAGRTLARVVDIACDAKDSKVRGAACAAYLSLCDTFHTMKGYDDFEENAEKIGRVMSALPLPVTAAPAPKR